MNRTTAAALVAAGIVGVVGGTVSAVVRGADDPSEGPSAGSAPSPTSGPTSGPAPEQRPAAVLYAAEQTIHDGERTIRFDARLDTPERLVRTADGYLLAQVMNTRRDRHRLHTVSREGTTSTLAEVVGRWDLDADRTRVVGTDLGTRRVTTWDLTDGTTTRGPRFAADSIPVWQGDRVLVSEPGTEQDPVLLHAWDPGTGDTTRTGDIGMFDLTASRDGGLLAGAVNLAGFSGGTENACLRVTAAPGDPRREWRTCDWRAQSGQSEVFSPDGSQVLAIPSESDGFGPGELATFSAGRGPSAGVESFAAPDFTLLAGWLDKERVVVLGKTDLDLDEGTGTWIRTCDLAGRCTDVASVDSGDLVLGEQG